MEGNGAEERRGGEGEEEQEGKGKEEEQAARVEARSALTFATLHGVTEAHMVDDPLAALGAFTDRSDLHLEPRDGVALKSLRQIILDLAVRGA